MEELNLTIISNEFLSKYLADTKPEYIKVFLFYLWKGIKEKYSICDASNEIDLSEDVIEMALKYWIKKDVIKKESLSKSTVDKIYKTDNTNNIIDLNTKKQEIIIKNRKDYSEVETDLLFVAEKLLGKTLSGRQSDLIAQCYNEYLFDESVIQYLLEYCSNKSQTDARYMGAVASSWYEKNVKSVDDAKKFIESFGKSSYNKGNKAKSNRTNDRKDVDYNQIFADSVSNGKFK